MQARVSPGGTLGGIVTSPGDKSIAHRWLLLASIAGGTSQLHGLPRALDVRSTASCLAQLVPSARETLDLWGRVASIAIEGGGSTWNGNAGYATDGTLEVEGEGFEGLRAPAGPLDCGNSGTSMRLLAGLLASAPFRSVLIGDDSLSRRPMERVAAPLREMGGRIDTSDGHAPIAIRGGRLHGIRYVCPLPSAQVKSAVLLAGLHASGSTTVIEPVPTRDHTERALRALGVDVESEEHGITLHAAPIAGFVARLPGDPSSAAFLVAAAALRGDALEIEGVGLNPTRIHYLDVLRRMGVRVDVEADGEEIGEPVGRLRVHPTQQLRGTSVDPAEVPLVIDEVPVLALVAAHASGETRFEGAAELRVKETDRLSAIARGIADLGGRASEHGDDLVVAGGGLRGGHAHAHGDHRMAMSFAIAALAADAPCTIEDIEAADVTFPGFVDSLRGIGANIEVEA